MTNILILALNFLFGVLILGRVGFQLFKRNDYVQRYGHIPSSSTYPTLGFDVALGCFLLGVVLLVSA